MIKPGVKLKSVVCDTEAMVIRCGEGAIACGGAAMALDKPAAAGEIHSTHASGTLMGKRYTDAAATWELLCIKPGKGSFSLNGVALVLKEAKPLPASD